MANGPLTIKNAKQDCLIYDTAENRIIDVGNKQTVQKPKILFNSIWDLAQSNFITSANVGNSSVIVATKIECAPTMAARAIKRNTDGQPTPSFG